ncbi:hypothetical protein [Anaerosinus sp.]|uniref:hypothetical protein n=1 Tax=Selenobaculum sp. TaxID=3074374 RepID=UPI003AB18CE6
MADTTVTNTDNSCNTQSVETATEDTKTTQITTNQSNDVNETITVTKPDENDCCCPCGHLDLDKLAEDACQCAFRSSNIVIATSNSIMVFTMIILQEVLKELCRSKNFNLDDVVLITSALAVLGDGININNPQPFNS